MKKRQLAAFVDTTQVILTKQHSTVAQWLARSSLSKKALGQTEPFWVEFAGSLHATGFLRILVSPMNIK